MENSDGTVSTGSTSGSNWSGFGPFDSALKQAHERNVKPCFGAMKRL